jgi:hypothetical protein
LLVDAGDRHRESPREIFDLKWFFHFTPFYGDFGAKFLSNYPD